MSGEWWRDAVVYEIYVRSFADSDGDGVGDLAGIRSRLPYLADLGVDALWLTPFYPSPMHDHGYDVADYCDVDPRFGTLADVDGLVAEAHALGLRVFVDVVPNHTSREHPWFRRALTDPASPERTCYFFRPPAPDGGPPNDWRSVFGGSAWTLDESSGDYYLHLFDSSQPDLDWTNPRVHELFRDVLTFWLDRGVDGFRIDVAHAVAKDPQLRDGRKHAWDQDAVFAVWEEWRAHLDGWPDRSFVGEVFLYDMDRVAHYVGATRLHQAFNFSLVTMPFEAAAIEQTVRRSLELFERGDTSPTWVLSNHDIVRHPTRFGGGEPGRRRARAATALILALPGSPYLYQGEELGLEQSDVPPEARQDPTWFRGGGIGRDGCRTPLPWSPEPPGHGFTTGEPWLPFDEQASARDVATQAAAPASTLAFYRRALALRRRLRPELDRAVEWPAAPEGCVGIRRRCVDGRVLAVWLNASDAAVHVGVGAGAEIVLVSTAADVDVDGDHLLVPPATTVWVLEPV